MSRTGDKTGICKLCREEAELRNSHIVPEFLYTPTYDEKHRALSIEWERVRAEQKGWRERLLCDACERQLNDDYEKPMSRDWPIPARMTIGNERLTGLDYETVKLFLLSVLWRAHVAARGEFANTSLGDIHGERMREMIRNRDPGAPDEYQVAGTVLVQPDSDIVFHSLVMGSMRTRMIGRHTHLMVFGGCAWMFVVSNMPMPDSSGIVLSPEGALEVEVIPVDRFEPLMGYLATRPGPVPKKKT